jgi:hypothetical protein
MPFSIAPGSVLRPELAGRYAEVSFTSRGFIAPLICKPAKVTSRQAVLYRLNKKSIMQSGAQKRAIGGNTPRGAVALSTDSYKLDEYTWEVPLDLTEKNLYGMQFDVEQDLAGVAAGVVALALEIDCASAMQNTTNHSVSNTGSDITGTPWTSASSTPVETINTVREKIRSRTGILPNTLRISNASWGDLSRHASVIALFKGMAWDPIQGRIPLQALAQALDLKQIIVSGGVKDSADEGQTFTAADVWDGTKAELVYVPDDTNIMSPASTRMLTIDGDGSVETDMGSMPAGVVTVDGIPLMIDEYGSPGNKSKMIRATSYAQFKDFDVDLVGVITGVR